jgi:hypothetical protein
MPDDFDTLPDDQGTDLDDIAEPSTVAGEGAQDLLGPDAAQSEDDLGGTPAQDEEDSQPSGDQLFDEADYQLLQYQPEQGIERIKQKVGDFLKNQNKAFSRRMSKIAKEYKPAQAKAKNYEALEAAMAVINKTDPEWVQSALNRLKAASEGRYGEWGKTVKENSSDQPLRSKDDLVNLIRSTVQESIGSLRQEYGTDKATSRVDDVLSRVKNDRLHALRGDLIKILSDKPSTSISQAVGFLDPDLLIELRGRPQRAEPVQRELSDYTTKQPRKFITFGDAFDDALARHGDPDLVRE